LQHRESPREKQETAHNERGRPGMASASYIRM